MGLGVAYTGEAELDAVMDRIEPEAGIDNAEESMILGIFAALIEAIESGQSGLPFDEGGEGNELIDPCPDCDGGGKNPDNKRKNCVTCKGKGTIPRSPKTSPGSG